MLISSDVFLFIFLNFLDGGQPCFRVRQQSHCGVVHCDGNKTADGLEDDDARLPPEGEA